MRHFVALALIASILSVSSIPLLPGATHCAHAAEATGGEDCTDCHSGKAVMNTMPEPAMDHDMCHEMTAVPQQVNHTDHDMDHHAMQQPSAHGQHQMTEAERECRIECGCGCNRIAEGFPLLLSPHVTTSMDFDSSISVSAISGLSFAALTERVRRIPIPPPQIS